MAGIQKRKSTAAKTSTQAPKAARKGGRTRSHNGNEAGEEELEGDDEQGDAPMVIDDHDNNDPLQHMQIKALMAEEKRKLEIHELDVRHREAQMTGTADLNFTRNRNCPCGRLRASASPLFSTTPKKHVIAIARNIFDPGNLSYLDNLFILNDLTSNVTISFEDGKIKQSKSVGKASAFKSPAIWSNNFITYVLVVSIFHGVKYPQIVRKLLEFHNTIPTMPRAKNTPAKDKAPDLQWDHVWLERQSGFSFDKETGQAFRQMESAQQVDILQELYHTSLASGTDTTSLQPLVDLESTQAPSGNTIDPLLRNDSAESSTPSSTPCDYTCDYPTRVYPCFGISRLGKGGAGGTQDKRVRLAEAVQALADVKTEAAQVIATAAKVKNDVLEAIAILSAEFTKEPMKLSGRHAKSNRLSQESG
ncbi:hypothetical protein V8E54_008259 [Elaphomyces granulatus]